MAHLSDPGVEVSPCIKCGIRYDWCWSFKDWLCGACAQKEFGGRFPMGYSSSEPPPGGHESWEFGALSRFDRQEVV